MPETTYTLVGDYYLPNIALSDPPDAEPLNQYGRMRKNYLKEHRRVDYTKLLLSDQLYPHCREIQQQANERIDSLMGHFMENDPPPDKEKDGLAWAAHMNMLKHTAEEIAAHEIVYS